MIHELKIFPKYFKDVVSGKKGFEIRENDRDFRVGDFLALNEWDGLYTGNCCLVEVVYILDRAIRIKSKKHIIMSIRPCHIGTTAQEEVLTRRSVYAVETYRRPEAENDEQGEV